MSFDHDHLVGPPLQQAADRLGNAGEPAILVGRDRPRAGIEGDCVDVDAAHPIAQLDIVADLVKRIGTLERHQRRRCQRLVEQVGRRDVEIDDVALARDGDDRRRQVERHHGTNAYSKADRKPGAEARTTPVLDDHHLAAIGTAAHAPQETAVRVGHVDDLHAARPLIDREVLIAAHLHTGIRRKAADALLLVHGDEDVGVGAHDRAVTLLDEGVAALVGARLALRARLLDARGALRTWRSSTLRTGHGARHRALLAELLRLTTLTGQASRATLLRKALLSGQALLSWATWATWAAQLGLAAGALLAELLLLARSTRTTRLTRGALSGAGLARSRSRSATL